MIIENDLYTKFNEVKYYDEPHKYYLDKQQLISVTTIIHQYESEFDEEYWANIKGDKYGINPRLIKRAWKFINNKGTMKGSIIHDYAENLFLNKIFKYPKEWIIDHFGFDPIYPEYLITKKHVDRFHNDVENKLIPVKTEMIVYDKESLIGGMMDMLFWNVKKQEYQIWDWKTNKSFTRTGSDCDGRRLTGSLSMLYETNLEIYSLQLGLYKYIIEKNSNIKIGGSYLVWFSHNNENYEIIKTLNRDYYVKQIVNERINSLN